MSTFKHHIFICENQRPPGSAKGCCFTKGAAEVRQAMKDEIDRRGWKKIVRANSAGCLDQCDQGVALVIYPENIWYGGVKRENVNEILDALKEGRVVEKLRIPEEKLTGKICSGNLP